MIQVSLALAFCCLYSVFKELRVPVMTLEHRIDSARDSSLSNLIFQSAFTAPGHIAGPALKRCSPMGDSSLTDKSSTWDLPI